MADKPHATALLAQLKDLATALQERTDDVSDLVAGMMGANLKGCADLLGGAQAIHDEAEAARAARAKQETV